MQLVIGLGNPGRKYSKTRHNAGFQAVDFLVGKNAKWQKDKKSNAEIIKKDGNMFVKPQTYVNESGKAVRALADYYKIPNDKIIIIYDEIDLFFGEVRVRDKGSSAGHNGIKSIISHLGTEEFKRIRIGISNDKREKMLADSPRLRQAEAGKFVLKKFSRGELKELEKSILPEVKNKIEEII
ncbi:aminoacyl-tRNA hydrolase [Patescibacteria group bacterium]